MTEFQDMKSLNWPARHLDRFLLQSLTREQWQETAKYLQGQNHPHRHRRAPPPSSRPKCRTLSAQDINRKLKARIQELPKAIDEYYLLLARRVDVVGSNKGEVFQVNRMPDGQLRVQMFDRAGDTDAPERRGPVRPHLQALRNRGSVPLRPRRQGHH